MFLRNVENQSTETSHFGRPASIIPQDSHGMLQFKATSVGRLRSPVFTNTDAGKENVSETGSSSVTRYTGGEAQAQCVLQTE
jgi:hypothetical protein